jgi:hypothetical protein
VPQDPISEPGAVEPIDIVPEVQYQAVVPQTVQRLVPGDTGPVFVDEPRPAWPYFVALFALLVGGLVGFLIGNSRRTDTTALTSSTQPLGSTVDTSVPSTLSETVSGLQDQIELLTAAQTKAAQDLTAAQTALTQAEAERDTLAAQVGSAGGATTALQAELDASKAQVSKLQADLKSTTTQLEAANASLTQTQASLKTLQGQLDEANATLTALNVVPLGNYVNGNISRARSDAQANGWTLIEQPGSSATAATGTVLEQIPAPNTNMVTGSVLFVKVK